MWTLSENKDWHYLESNFVWVSRMNGVPQDVIHHAEGDVAIHTQMVLDELLKQETYKQLDGQQKEILWAAALLHDVEKFSTTVIEPDGRITSNGHARKGAMTSRTILYKDIPAPFHIREQIVALVRYHGLTIWLFEKPDPLKSLVMASYELNSEWLTLLAQADMLGRLCGDKDDMLYRVDCFEAYCREQEIWRKARNFASGDARMYFLAHEDTYVDYVPFDDPDFEVIMMSGLPGAGKNTFISKNYPNWPMVSLDDIRVKWKIAPDDKSGNGRVVQEAKEQARVFLRKKQSFVWNATNTTFQMRQQLTELFATYKAKVKIVYVEVAYATLLKQNENREHAVPGPVIEKLVAKLEVPATWEAHEVEYHIS